MNPYAALFTNGRDQFAVWFCVAVWILFGAFLARTSVARKASLSLRSERYCQMIALPVFVLSIVLTVNMGVGLVLMWFHVVSVFWIFWEVLYLCSVIAVFQVLPCIYLVLIIWAVIGRRQKGYGKRTLVLPIAGVLMLCVFSVLDFAVSNYACRQ